MTPIIASYLTWQPVIAADEVYQQAIAFSYVSTDEAENLFWIENRPEQEGRSVLVMRDSAGNIRDLFEKPFSARSRVFEYGSQPYVAARGTVYFVNAKDQRIYKVSYQQLEGLPTPITTERTKDGGLAKYADLQVSPDGRWLVFASEKEYSDREAVNEIAVIDLHADGLQQARTLAHGADFYKSPKFSKDGARLAWLEWNHPFMPWDSTLLMQAEFHANTGIVQNPQRMAGSEKSSIPSFDFTANGSLVFAMDYFGHADDEPHNYSNLYEVANGNLQAVTKSYLDFVSVRARGNSVYALAYDKGAAKLMLLQMESLQLAEIPTTLSSFSAPTLFGERFVVVGTSPKSPSSLVEISMDGTAKIIKTSSVLTVDPADISPAVPVTFPTSDGEVSHGYFYQPVNSKYTAPVGELPPVRVLVHGGPTAMTSPGFSKQLLFWTSQGYAVFDVNYRGSTGFGRRYRDALLKKWGVLEILDVKDGLAALRSEGLISDQAVVSGGSAGGYTVQRLLTYYPDLFAVGASHFGIGNLVTLQKLTHKFESRYLQQLIGGTLEDNLQEYEERSPIHHLDTLKSPMIIFQGSEDKVVPPENSREMAEILKEKGIQHAYHEYPGEAHGFRQKENLVDALTREAAFFRQILAKRVE